MSDSLLALFGLVTIVVLLLVILTKRLTALVALIVVPITAALLAGFGLDTAQFMVAGVKAIAPVCGMFVFAILFFGILADAGALDPIINRILAMAGVRPTRIVVGSALLALLIHLDGSGAVCFLITIPAMLPLYERLGMDKRILACVVSLAAGVNFLPWTGPMIRSAAALKVNAVDIFTPLIPVQAVGLVFVFIVAYFMGKREERRLGLSAHHAGATQGMSGDAAPAVSPLPARKLTEEEIKLRRPHLFWINIAIAFGVMGTMVFAAIEPVVMFMVGTVLALILNYPNVKTQMQRVDAHAKQALTMAGILFAAGVFTGIMAGSGMLNAMAKWAGGFVSPEMAGHIPFGLALISMPLSLLFDPDSFYFGIMPTIAEVYKNSGGVPIQVAQASVLGQMTTGFPVSPLTPATFLIVGLTGVDLAEHQKFSIPWLFLASVIMAVTAATLGVFPF